MLRFLVILCSLLTACRSSVCPCERPELCQQIREEKDFEVNLVDQPVAAKTWPKKAKNLWTLRSSLAATDIWDTLQTVRWRKSRKCWCCWCKSSSETGEITVRIYSDYKQLQWANVAAWCCGFITQVLLATVIIKLVLWWRCDSVATSPLYCRLQV